MLSKRILTLVFVVAFLTLLVGCFPSPALPNQAPIITSDPNTTATVGEAYTYDVEATDSDEDTLTYSLAVRPFGMTIHSLFGIISWDPQIKDVGDHDVIVKVSDGDLDITQSFTITVVEEEEPYVPPCCPPTPTPTPTKKYTITATADTGGSINPSGAVVVNHGANQTFTITSYSPFYRLLEVWVDGGSEGDVSTYTFTNVTDDHTIHADFILIGPVYNETQDDHYDFIQEAINSSETYPGDTILVMAGIYPENVVILADKDNLQLIGSGSDVTSIAPVSGSPMKLPGWLLQNERPFDGFRIQGFTLVTADASHAVLIGSGTPDNNPYTTNLEFEDIVVDGGGRGIGLNAVQGVTFNDVHINNISISGEAGLELTGVSDLVFTQGSIMGNYIGIRLQPTGPGDIGDGYGPNDNLHINDSSLSDNTTAIENQDASTIIDATNNWWGDASGPYNATTNPFGLGNAVSDYVNYGSWNTSP